MQNKYFIIDAFDLDLIQLIKNLFVNFRAVNGNIAGGLDAQFHLVAVNGNDDHANVVTDHDRLIDFAAQNQHRMCPPWLAGEDFG